MGRLSNLSKGNHPTTTPDWQAAVRRRTQFYVLVAVLLAVLFGILVFQLYFRQQQVAPGKLTSAVFTSQEINMGTVLTAEMLEVREVTHLSVSEVHFRFEEEANSDRFNILASEENREY